MLGEDLQEEMDELQKKVENLEGEKELLIRQSKILIELVNNYEDILDEDAPGAKLRKESVFDTDEEELDADIDRLRSHVKSLEYKLERVYDMKVESL
jgi:uncharacterized protein YicC (UPF0701 family)